MRDEAVAGVINFILALALLTSVLVTAKLTVGPANLRIQEGQFAAEQASDMSNARLKLLAVAGSDAPAAGATPTTRMGASMSWFLSQSFTTSRASVEDGQGLPSFGFARATVKPAPIPPPVVGEGSFEDCFCNPDDENSFKVNPTPLSRDDPASLETFTIRITDRSLLGNEKPGGTCQETTFRVYAVRAGSPPPLPEAETDDFVDEDTLWIGTFVRTHEASHEGVRLKVTSGNRNCEEVWSASNGATISLRDTADTSDTAKFYEAVYATCPPDPEVCGSFDVWFVNAGQGFGQFTMTGVDFTTEFPPPEVSTGEQQPQDYNLELRSGALTMSVFPTYSHGRTWTLEPAGLLVERDGGSALLQGPDLRVTRAADNGLDVALRWFNVTSAEGKVAGGGTLRTRALAETRTVVQGESENLTLRIPTRFPAHVADQLLRNFLAENISSNEYVLAAGNPATGSSWVDLTIFGPCRAGEAACADFEDEADLHLDLQVAAITLRLGGS
ncbi:MAG TPA: hypothetical protein VGR28_02945 [Candidatus Thermoplasmatota archaeon]|jgi:hypothetical protein|nr:hypothetical protein [Candidatus Thermoplasmatota archaeon]